MRIIFKGGEVLDLNNIEKIILDSDEENTAVVGSVIKFCTKEDIKRDEE